MTPDPILNRTPANSALITTRFSATSTADDVLDGIDLTGVRAVVTGATSGLGLETARALASAGAEVTIAVRNPIAGNAVADDIFRNAAASAAPRNAVGSTAAPSTTAAPNTAAPSTAAPSTAPAGITTPTVLRLHVATVDLANPASVAAFVDGWTGPLHLLINNAGLVTGGLERTPEGWELQFATNHLGHFALATGLHAALARGAADRNGSRIVALTSTAHMRANIDFDDLHFERRDYNPQLAYAQAKTANSLFAVEATRLWAADGIVANAVNPGGIATGLQRNFTPEQKASLDAAEAAGLFAYKSVEQGAATTLVAAVSPEFASTGAHYLDDGREAYTVPNDASLADHPHGVKQWALDPEAAQRLWSVSLETLRR